MSESDGKAPSENVEGNGVGDAPQGSGAGGGVPADSKTKTKAAAPNSRRASSSSAASANNRPCASNGVDAAPVYFINGHNIFYDRFVPDSAPGQSGHDQQPSYSIRLSSVKNRRGPFHINDPFGLYDCGRLRSCVFNSRDPAYRNGRNSFCTYGDILSRAEEDVSNANTLDYASGHQMPRRVSQQPPAVIQALMPPPPRPIVRDNSRAVANGEAQIARNDAQPARNDAQPGVAECKPNAQVVVNGDPVPIGQIKPKRQPRNMQGLLQLALDATSHDEVPDASHSPMSDERRQFLDDAIKNMTLDISKVVRDALHLLSNEEKVSAVKAGEPVPEEMNRAFENLVEYVYDLDAACDFFRLGGLSLFYVCFESANSEIRAKAYTLFAEVCQNNPSCQKYAAGEMFVKKLVTCATKETGECLAKLLYALSSLVRTYEPACNEFYDNDGCGVLMDILMNNPNDSYVLLKVVHLVKALITKDVRIKEYMISKDIAASLLKFLDNKNLTNCTEHAIEALLFLAEEGHPSVVETLRTPEALRLIKAHIDLPYIEGYSNEHDCSVALLNILTNDLVNEKTA